MLLNRSVPDIQTKRTQWRELEQIREKDRLVFLDESGINIDLSRRYGRSIGQKRVIGSVPLSTPQRLTILSSVRSNGETTLTTYQGGTTGERFVTYLKDVLIPTLKPGDIVVMDNMRSHHVKSVEQTLLAAGMIPLYLPPYSPDLNPIEMLWSKLKAILRKWGIRLAGSLPDAVRHAFTHILPSDCLHWFAADGYC